jgi:hypothetical protein
MTVTDTNYWVRSRRPSLSREWLKGFAQARYVSFSDGKCLDTIFARVGLDFDKLIADFESSGLSPLEVRTAIHKHVLSTANMASSLVSIALGDGVRVSIAVKLLWFARDGRVVVRTLARNAAVREIREAQLAPNYFPYQDNTAFEEIARAEDSERYFASDNLLAKFATNEYRNARDSWSDVYNATAVVGIPGWTKDQAPLLGYLCADIPAGKLSPIRVRRVLERLALHLYHVFRLLYSLEALDLGLERNAIRSFVAGEIGHKGPSATPGFRWDGKSLAPANLARQLLFQKSIGLTEDAHDRAAWVLSGRDTTEFVSGGECRPAWRSLAESAHTYSLSKRNSEVVYPSRGDSGAQDLRGHDLRQSPRKEGAMEEDQSPPPGYYTSETLPPISVKAKEILERALSRAKPRHVVSVPNNPYPHLFRLPEHR